MDFNAWLIDVSGQIDGFLYTYILLALLVIVGIYYTIRTKAVQIRYIKDMFTQITEKKHVEGKRSISSFQALMVSTASRVGTGNIHRGCSLRVHRVHARADLEGSRQGRRVPRRPRILHPPSTRQPRARRAVLRAADLVLRFRL